MLIALRALSLGDEVVEPGQPISVELQRSLPAGRIEQLKEFRHVEEVTDEARIEALVGDLTRRIEKLERKLNTQPKRKAV